ncbi:unnamed protein product, partial [Sphacelaria rigidula]
AAGDNGRQIAQGSKMEQVFFRLHVRCVTTVTRLLPPKARRVLEYVTLANAFCLLLSLAWLHAHFVNPKGQGPAVSCLPAALARAGVDPAHLHVLQIHIRTPSNEEQERPTALSTSSSPSSSDALTENEQPRHNTALHSNDGLAASSSAASSGRGATVPPDPGTPSLISSTGSLAGGIDFNNEDTHDAERAHGCSSGDKNEGAADMSVGEKLPSEPLPSEVFYSMKVVAGKDAVGTLSGPGTLGIERRRANVGGAGEGGGWTGSSSGGGGNICGEGSNRGNSGGEERRPAVRTLLDALSWGGSGGQEGGSGRKPMGGLNGHGVEAQMASVDDRGALGGYGPTAQRAPKPSEDAGGAGVGLDGRSSGGFDEEHVVTGMGAGYARGKGRSGNGGGGQDALVFPDEVYLYSLEKGFLMLRPDLRQKHGIVTANVTVSVHDPCLGGPVIQVTICDM